MPVRLVPCRHKTTGNTASIPESALRAGLFPRWIPIEPLDPEPPAVEPAPDAAPAESSTRERKSAARGEAPEPPSE
jgi:hypothetical protein